MLRYVWLADERAVKNNENTSRDLRYQKRPGSAAVASQSAGQPIPQVVDQQRKENCRLNLKLFFETYFPAKFNRGWGPDHLRVIEKSITFMVACLPGNAPVVGKTTICEMSAIWAALYGHRKYILLIGATETPRQNRCRNQVRDRKQRPPVRDLPEVCYRSDA